MVQKKPVIWRMSRLYPPNFTGAGIQAYREDRAFVQRGFSVFVIAAGISSAKAQSGKTASMNGVTVNYLPIISNPLWLNEIRSRLIYKLFFFIIESLSSLSFSLGCAWKLLLSGRREDIVIFEALDSFMILTVTFARLKKMHTILRMNLLGTDDPYSRFVRARKGQILENLKLFVFKSVDSVVSICTAMIESCDQAGVAKTKQVYIPYGVNTQLFKRVEDLSKAEIRRKLGLEQNKKYIIFVGSAIERKGIDIMVDSFLSISGKMKDIELLIVGPCEFDPRLHYNGRQLQEMVENSKDKINLAQSGHLVHWIGQVENVHEYMNAADVFCLPTRREGFGLVIIEAMASGLPVVVARLDGITTDIIPSDDVGILIPGYSHQDYAKAIMTLLTDPEKAAQMGSAARQRALSEFSLEGTVEKWLDLFQNLSQLNGRRIQ